MSYLLNLHSVNLDLVEHNMLLTNKHKIMHYISKQSKDIRCADKYAGRSTKSLIVCYFETQKIVSMSQFLQLLLIH